MTANKSGAPTHPAVLFRKRTRIRFGQCDPAGIVFYPQYFVMFNGLIEDWVTEALGIEYADLLGRRRTGLPTVSLNCDFKAISRMGDEVLLGLQVERLGARSISLRLDCCGEGDGVLRAGVGQVIVTTDLDTHRSIDIPPDLREAIAGFAELPEI